MTKDSPRHLRASDLRSLVRLATQATTGVTRVVEGVHQSVWSTLGFPGAEEPGRTRGITGLVFRSLQGVTELVGSGADAALAILQPVFDSVDGSGTPTPQREAVLAALNGVMGDHLVEDGNSLAIPMNLRFRGEVIDSEGWPPKAEATGKVLLLAHGLCMNDLQWQTEHEGRTVNHGEELASALGYTPVYLRYNSGLHISENGSELAEHLERLVRHWPVPLEELSVVVHSMGGLVVRSAIHSAKEANGSWLKHLKNIVFLGTPHHGAPLEKAGHGLDLILGSTPYTAPFARLTKLRSAGITDLRYGHFLDEDWQGRDRFHRQPDSHRHLPLPDGVACYTVAATAAEPKDTLANRLVGDGLVPLRSALGEHDDAGRTLGFAKASQWIVYRTNHLGLLSSPEVTRQLMKWLEPPKAR